MVFKRIFKRIREICCRNSKKENESEVLEIVVFGRGGQGAVTAAEIIGKAFMFIVGIDVRGRPGRYSADRQGAPVKAFVRVGGEKILARHGIDKADGIIILDPSLVKNFDFAANLKEQGWAIINTSQCLEYLAESVSFPSGSRIFGVDATSLAIKHGLGTSQNPVVNTAILGVLAEPLALVSWEELERAVSESVPKKTHENISALKESSKIVQVLTGSGDKPCRTPEVEKEIEKIKKYEDEKAGIQREVLKEIRTGGKITAVSKVNSMRLNLTGTWRTYKPVYEKKDAPCGLECPAGEKIPVWVSLLNEGKVKQAWEVYASDNPFPAICGRVCFKFCEAKCNRKFHDEPVAINALERFIGDEALKNNWIPQAPELRKNSGKIAIIGAGPAGLSAAYFLRMSGFPSIIFEAESFFGGLLKTGISEYRLPKKIVDREIMNNIFSLGGIDLKLRSNIEKEDFQKLKSAYQWVLFAVGAPYSNKLGMKDESICAVIPALEFLRMVNAPVDADIDDLKIGPRVAVIGGGNTAIETARTALRLGGTKEVWILYRRGIKEMPAFHEEVEQVLKEGVKLRFFVQPESIDAIGDKKTLRLKETRFSGEFDESGKQKAAAVRGSDFELKFDTIIAAIGEHSDLSGFGTAMPQNARFLPGMIFQPDEKRIVLGDAFSGPASVTHAIASGKKAAEAIAGAKVVKRSPAVGFKDINLDYFPKRLRIRPPKTFFIPGDKNFSEINLGVPEEAVKREVSRCFNCGWCNKCGNCRLFCMDNAVIKTESGDYEINYDYCKGCGVCVKECPRCCMDMVKEVI